MLSADLIPCSKHRWLRGGRLSQGLPRASFLKKTVSRLLCQYIFRVSLAITLSYITPWCVTIPSRSGSGIPSSPTHVKLPPAAPPQIQQWWVAKIHHIILNIKKLWEKSLPRPLQMRGKKAKKRRGLGNLEGVGAVGGFLMSITGGKCSHTSLDPANFCCSSGDELVTTENLRNV